MRWPSIEAVFLGQPGKGCGGHQSRVLEDGDCCRPRARPMVVPVEAQLNTQHIKGTGGRMSGSQAPPGVYFIAPLFCVFLMTPLKLPNP